MFKKKKSAIRAPSVSSSCLEQCVAYQMVSPCVCLYHRPCAWVRTRSTEGWTGFPFFSSSQGTGQGRWAPGPWGGGTGEYRPRRRKGAPGQLEGPFHRGHTCTSTHMHTHAHAHPRTCTQATGQSKKHTPQTKASSKNPFSLLTRRIVDS